LMKAESLFTENPLGKWEMAMVFLSWSLMNWILLNLAPYKAI